MATANHDVVLIKSAANDKSRYTIENGVAFVDINYFEIQTRKPY